MEEEEIEKVQNLDDDWIIVSNNQKWKETIKDIEKYLLENCNPKITNGLLVDLNRFIEILVKDGATYDDIVLKIGILYLFNKKTGTNIEQIQKDVSLPVLKGVDILMNNSNAGLKEYLKNVFNSETKYLKKIKLAEYILKLESAKNNDITNQVKLITEVDFVINNYKSNLKLMQKLIEVRNKF